MTNREHSRLKKLRQKKYRQENNLFLVEGIRPLGVLHESDYFVEQVIVCTSLLTSSGREFLEKHRRLPVVELDSQRFEQLSSEITPQGILAVVQMKNHTVPIKADLEFILVAEKISDPSNLGSLLRSARAFDAGVILGTESAELYSPKVISASSGYLFKIRIEVCPDIPGRLKNLKKKAYQIWAGDVDGDNIRKIKKLPEKLALAIGHEAFGLSDSARQEVDRFVTIPISSEVESLSAPVAGAILMYILSGE